MTDNVRLYRKRPVVVAAIQWTGNTWLASRRILYCGAWLSYTMIALYQIHHYGGGSYCPHRSRYAMDNLWLCCIPPVVVLALAWPLGWMFDRWQWRYERKRVSMWRDDAD